MYLPPIEPDCNYEPFVSGDVTIAASAAIAPGVIIQAAPDARIVIASGVCIGMGAIIHAYNGTIEVEKGATIGAGVLVVGQAKIAARACIGSLTTLMSSDLEAQETVAAGSILGDTSRQVSENSPPASMSDRTEATEEAEATASGVPTISSNTEEAQETTEEKSQYVSPGPRHHTFIQPKPISIPETATPTNIEEETTISSNAQEAQKTTEEEFQYASPESGYHTFIQPKPISIPGPTTNTNKGAIVPAAETEASESEEEQKPQTPKTPVAGLDYVQGMMKTLFPHKNISLSREDEED